MGSFEGTAVIGPIATHGHNVVALLVRLHNSYYRMILDSLSITLYPSPFSLPLSLCIFLVCYFDKQRLLRG